MKTNSQLLELERRLGPRFDGIDARLGGVDRQIDDLSARVGVLVEEAKREIRVAFEAIQGNRQDLLARIGQRADSIDRNLEVVALAVQADAARDGHGPRRSRRTK